MAFLGRALQAVNILFLVILLPVHSEVEDSFCHVRGGGLFPHPTDCSKFVICTYGRAITQSCAPSMLFDAQVKACNYEHSTSCVGDLLGLYPRQPHPDYSAGYYEDREESPDNHIHQYPDYKDSRNSHGFEAPYYGEGDGYHGIPRDRHGLPGRYHEIYYARPNGLRETELSYSDNRHDSVYTPTEPYYHNRQGRNYQETQRPTYEDPNRHRESFPRDIVRGRNANNVYNEFYSKPRSPNQDYYGNTYGLPTRQSNDEKFENDHQTKQTRPKYQIDVEDDEKDYIPRRSFINPDIKPVVIVPTKEFVKDQKKPLENTVDSKQSVVIVKAIKVTEDLPQKEPSMFHFVHVDIPDPEIFKRVRRPGESFIDFTAETQKEELDCPHGDGMYADAKDCTRYIQCANNNPFRKRCPAGTYFSASSGICGYDRIGCADGGKARKKADRVESEREEKIIIHEEDGGMNMAAIEEFMRTSLVKAKANAIQIIHQEVEAAKVITERRRPFRGVAAFLGSSPYVKQLSLPAFLQLECLRMIKDRFHLGKTEILIVMSDMGSALPLNPVVVSPDMQNPTPSMNSCPYPMNGEDNDCDPNAKYRTFDGSCNNLHHPLWGKSFRAVGRFLQPDYADGIGELRHAVSGRPLPSARAVSLKLFTQSDTPIESHVHTVMMMTFGQFLDHDLVRTAVTKLSKDESGTGDMVDVMCGESECETEGAENRACEPIPVPNGDPDFTNKTCLMFVRTQEVMRDNCELAPREQLNQLTSWLDSSMVYGSDKNQSDKLRDRTRPRRGQLATIRHPYDPSYKDLLPQIENKDCRGLNSTIMCFTAGDGRVNEQIGLIALHTVFTRAHNGIEEQLHQLNPHWDGDKLYQESRRILGAGWQVIVYREYLPLVLGPVYMKRFGLELQKEGYWEGYSDDTNPDVTNSFATAAFRFGHSQIGDLIQLTNQLYNRAMDIKFSTILRRPLTVYETRLPAGSAVDSILLGMSSQPAEDVDTHFSKEMTVRLFSENPPTEPGLDLPAINTQRGRDHGVPGYNHWREWCGLSVAKTFDDLVDIPYKTRLQLSELYEQVDDIDLFPAGVAEEHIPGGVVGPTFGCILARQFRILRIGDRYWHERPDPKVRFTPGQLQEVRQFTLAQIMCENTDRIDDVQHFVMLQPLSAAVKSLGTEHYLEAYNLASLYRGENNERHPCSHLPQPDLSLWKEERT